MNSSLIHFLTLTVHNEHLETEQNNITNIILLRLLMVFPFFFFCILITP